MWSIRMMMVNEILRCWPYLDPTNHQNIYVSLDQWTCAQSDVPFLSFYTCFEDDHPPFNSHDWHSPALHSVRTPQSRLCLGNIYIYTYIHYTSAGSQRDGLLWWRSQHETLHEKYLWYEMMTIGSIYIEFHKNTILGVLRESVKVPGSASVGHLVLGGVPGAQSGC